MRHWPVRSGDRGQRRGRAYGAALVLVITITIAAVPAHAQGCAQCRDNTASTSPATQRAYRRAIFLMSGAAGSLFAATLLLFKRYP